MHKQRNAINFSGENIYAGIDVHLKHWTVTILTETRFHKKFTQPSDPSVLSSYLHTNFPGATYHSVYEAGFCGVWAHYELLKMKVNNIVVNPADVPTTQKEKLQKTDVRDSGKLARSLRAGELVSIHTPSISTMEARSLVRTRSCIVKDLTRMKQRIKSFLYLHGISYPDEFEKSDTHWSKRFMQWLHQIELTTAEGKEALCLLIRSAEELRKILLDATRRIRALSKDEKYREDFHLICTVPGIGLITGMTFLTEIEDIKRFYNTDKLAGFVGLVPTCHNSGPKEENGEMTFRGQSQIKTMLIESAWTAARIDPALCQSYAKLIHRMQANKVIIKIARKLLNRIYFVLKNKKEYVRAVVS